VQMCSMETKWLKYNGNTKFKGGNHKYRNKRNPGRTVLGKERVNVVQRRAIMLESEPETHKKIQKNERDILLLQILLTEYEIEYIE
jgi:hypothetical protein